MSMPPTLRWICSKLHLWMGLALSGVLVILSLTGSALVFHDEIDRLLHPELLQVEPRGERVSLDRVVRRARATFPESAPQHVRLPQTPRRTYMVTLADSRHVYVHPYTGEVLGARRAEEGIMGVLFALHVELMAGATGAWIVGLSGLVLTLLCFTGLVLWWPSWRRIRVALSVVWRRGWRRLNYDLHRAGGFYTAAFILLTALTGSALIFYYPTGDLLRTVTGAEAPPPPPRSAPPAGRAPVSLDAALRTAKHAFPDAVPTYLYVPQAPRAPITVRMRAEGELHPNGRSYVYIGRYRGSVLRIDDAREAPAAQQLLYALYPLHIGSWGGAVGGPVVRVLYVLLGLAPTALVVTGTLIWYRRWREKTSSEPVDRDVPARPVSNVQLEMNNEE